MKIFRSPRGLCGFLLAACLATSALATSRPVVFESGDSQATLLELYTSEGCSSCPPAEAWLARLRGNADLWKQIVPVALHVDYWDNLGWPDRFARPAFTERQRNYAAAWNSESVYTPEFVVNGHEWHPGTLPEPVSSSGKLSIRVESPTSVTVSFKSETAGPANLVAELAPLADGVVSDVRGGENSGRKLAHEFIALNLLSAPMESHHGEWIAHFTLPAKTVAPVGGLAAWVHAPNDATPLQATGGWLPGT